MSLKSTLKFLLNHELNSKSGVKVIFKFFKWQVLSRIFGQSIVFKFAEKSKMILTKGLTGASGNYYCGLHEFEEMSFLLKFLREDDLFVDVGANVGSYTILAASEVGAKTISFEPLPATFKVLTKNITLNAIEEKATAYNIGLGSTKDILKFTNTHDTMNHVAISTDVNTTEVQVDVFDDLVNIDRPTLVKIDVEGFETEVLKGMSKALKNENLKAIIIELNGSGKIFGYDDNDIHEKLELHGFKPYAFKPLKNQLQLLDTYYNYNTIYIKDVDFCIERINSSKIYKINEIRF